MHQNLHNVFVYGTLKRGHRAEHFLDRSHFIGSAASFDKFEVFGDSFPLAVPSENGHRLLGELYQVTEDTRASLDQYEGYPSFYSRSLRDFELTTPPRSFDVNEKGQFLVEAWMYFIPPHDKALYGEKKPLKPHHGFLNWERSA